MTDYVALMNRLRNANNWLRQGFGGMTPAVANIIEDAPFEAADAIGSLLAERDALRTALVKYGRHTEFCAYWLWLVYRDGLPKSECDCGLSALLLSKGE